MIWIYIYIWFKNNFKYKNAFKISILHFMLILGYVYNLNSRHYSLQLLISVISNNVIMRKKFGIKVIS